VNRPQSLNFFMFPNGEAKELGSVATPAVLRVLRPASFALWFMLFVAQLVTTISTGELGNWFLIAISTLLFGGVHLQFWYEESDHGRKFHHALERMRGRMYEDEDTGLPNSRHFIFELRRQMMRSVRNGRGFSLVLTDVLGSGRLKQDEERTYAAMGRNLRQSLGDGDFVARLQGPIFAAIVLDERDQSAAEKADGLVPALGAALPLDKAGVLQPVVSVSGYEGEIEVRDFLRRAQRDLQQARGRASGPLYNDPARVLGTAA
jgi:GGDEF domain-containing protein